MSVAADRAPGQARADVTGSATAAGVAETSRVARHRAHAAPELAVIVPTLDARDNIEPLIGRLRGVLGGIAWEVIFVDDDSQDGTWPLLLELQRRLPQVRALRRIERRGLASACIEGMLACAAPYLAVIDADLQHDETILPTMLATLKARALDVVIGTRFARSGSAGELSHRRLAISRLGRLASRAISRADLSDPMSGFFVVRRDFLEETVHRLSGHGFKLLLDLLASAPRPVRFAEVPYRFRPRRHGRSKLDAPVLLDYVTLIGDKLLGRYLPVRLVIGLFGIVVHLAVLRFVKPPQGTQIRGQGDRRGLWAGIAEQERRSLGAEGRLPRSARELSSYARMTGVGGHGAGRGGRRREGERAQAVQAAGGPRPSATRAPSASLQRAAPTSLSTVSRA